MEATSSQKVRAMYMETKNHRVGKAIRSFATFIVVVMLAISISVSIPREQIIFFVTPGILVCEFPLRPAPFWSACEKYPKIEYRFFR